MEIQQETLTTRRPGVRGSFAGRWILHGFAAMILGELLFALVSGLLDNRGQVLEIAGHLPTLFLLGALVAAAQRRALRVALTRTPVVVCGVLTTAAYVAGFTVAGPPFDFLLSIVAIGFATGAGLWWTLRSRIAGAAWFIPAVGLGYAVGAVAGVGLAMLFGDQVDHAFGGGVTGFMGVVGMIGIVAGAVGSTLSGLALTRVLRADPAPS